MTEPENKDLVNLEVPQGEQILPSEASEEEEGHSDFAEVEYPSEGEGQEPLPLDEHLSDDADHHPYGQGFEFAQDIQDVLNDDDDDSDKEKEDGLGDAEFIKAPRKTLLGEWELDELAAHSPDDQSVQDSKSVASIHFSQMDCGQMSNRELAEMTEFVITTLEEDVTKYFESVGMHLDEIDFHEETDDLNLGLREKISCSSVSIASQSSKTLPGEPSKVRMYYAKGKNIKREESLPRIHGEGKDEIVEVTLHRSRKWHRTGKPTHAEVGTQTKTMTFVSEIEAQYIYMDIYPKPDDWVPPGVSDRQKSVDKAMEVAEHEDPKVDRSRKGPHIINFHNRKKLLQPLRDDYFKDETFWTGSRFRGEYKNRQFHLGHYAHPTGVKYESEWRDGHFHTSRHYGLVQYPRGDTFEGQWYQGRYVSGEITFGDGLKYDSVNWKYCESPDRRFRVERYYGMKPAGDTIFNDQHPLQKLPPGQYDVGDGFYNPVTGEIRGYDGFFLRMAAGKEHEWITKNCNKAPAPGEEFVPTFHPERIPGAYPEQLQRFSITKKSYH